MGSNEDELEKLNPSMDNEFEMPDIRNLTHFLGMEIVNTKHEIFYEQLQSCNHSNGNQHQIEEGFIR